MRLKETALSVALACCLAGPAIAQTDLSPGDPPTGDPSATKYLASLVDQIRIIRPARTALYCGLRSQFWFSRVHFGLWATYSGLRERLQGSSADPRSFAAYADHAAAWANEVANPPIPNQAECAALVDSPALAKADQFEYRVTGGYR